MLREGCFLFLANDNRVVRILSVPRCLLFFGCLHESWPNRRRLLDWFKEAKRRKGSSTEAAAAAMMAMADHDHGCLPVHAATTSKA
ncbi:hypothetical protein TYRP_019073 [Tyrophagus putrescentiae]|nr:hypothetical protein TYRP_019073 [Tyrophagus putrescentiae]